MVVTVGGSSGGEALLTNTKPNAHTTAKKTVVPLHPPASLLDRAPTHCRSQPPVRSCTAVPCLQ